MQTIYILVGLPGSGKSTFAKKMCETRDTQLIRINQDERGSRQACLSFAKEALTYGHDLVIDRCNFNKIQRSYWINLAKEYKCRVVCIVMAVDRNICVERALARQGHETMNEPARIPGIIDGMQKLVEAPDVAEGIDLIQWYDEKGDLI